jgi:hypothetical protein
VVGVPVGAGCESGYARDAAGGADTPEGVPLFVNARIDTVLRGGRGVDLTRRDLRPGAVDPGPASASSKGSTLR